MKRGDEIRVDFEALKSNFALDENGREGSIEPVPEGALSEAIRVRYFEKYDMEEVFGEEVPDWWFYRVTPG